MKWPALFDPFEGTRNRKNIGRGRDFQLSENISESSICLSYYLIPRRIRALI